MAQALPLIAAQRTPPPSTVVNARADWRNRQAFEELLSRLDADPDRAGDKYAALHRRLCRFFERQRCPCAEDHADDTLDRLARRLQSGETVDDLNGYAFGVARMVTREARRAQYRERDALSDLVRRGAPLPDLPADAREDRLERCFDELPRSSLDLILAYYEREKSAKIRHRNHLAAELGISRDALRSRAHRVRGQLRRALIASPSPAAEP